MYPHERSLVNKLAEYPFAIVGVNSDSDRDAIREVIKSEEITWRSFWNGPEGPDGQIASQWNVTGWPTTYVLDHEGVIRFKDLRSDDLERALEMLLGEMGFDVKLGEPAVEEAAASAEEEGAAGAGDDAAAGGEEGAARSGEQNAGDAGATEDTR